jgi:hypothetical protein
VSALEDQLVIQVRAAGLPEPVREHRFAPPRRWRWDLCWPDRLLACEVQGGVWSGGRHTRPRGYAADCEKRSEAAIRGWRIIEVTGDMVFSGQALALIERALATA